MRISDWSSDVCSSDLLGKPGALRPIVGGGHEIGRYVKAKREAAVPHCCSDLPRRPASAAADVDHPLAGGIAGLGKKRLADRSEEHTSELQSLMRISYAVFCLKQKKSE